MKLKARTKKNIRGSLTVLLVIILLPTMTFSALIVDMSRVNMAKQMMSSSGNLAMNTALANYDTVLKDVYGLFAMSQNKSKEELAADIQNYFEETLVEYGAVDEDYAEDYVSALMGDFNDLLGGGYNLETTDFLNLENIKANASGAPGSSLAESSVLRKQIVEYMKYRAPLNFGLGFIDSLKSFASANEQTEVVEAQVKAQESAQSVTQACSKLITLIREYDKLVKKIDSGDKALTGENSSSDGVTVPLEDYYTHVDKYRQTWGDNYEDINRLTLVFLANSPSVDSLYLKGLNYSGGERFVKKTGIQYDGSGVPNKAEVADSTSAAKTQVTNQIAALLGEPLTKAKKYKEQDFINSGLLNDSYTSFSDEESAVESFVEFKKFLNNESSAIRYSDVTDILEELYALGKYYDNFVTKINGEIERAQNQANAAQEAIDTQTGNRDTAASAMKNISTNINSKLANHAKTKNAFESLESNPALQSQVKTLFETTLSAVSGGYDKYYKNNLEKNPYLKMMKKIATDSTLKEDKDLKKICEKAEDFLEDSKGKSFSGYMKGKLGNGVTKKNLYKILNCLHECSQQVKTYSNKLTAYEEANSRLSTEEGKLSDANKTVARKTGERDGVKAQYEGCLGQFETFGSAYQADLYWYSKYIETAKNIVSKKAERVKTNFSTLKSNIRELKTKLEAIDSQITTAKKAVETYQSNVNTWETKNNTYSSKNGADSFSKQCEGDIKSARTEYDLASFDTLYTFVDNLRNEFAGLDAYLTDSVHYQYGSKKIDTISTAEDAVTAISSIKSSLSTSVTTEEANNFFGQLYNSDKTPEFVPYTIDYTKQLQFLKPTVLQITILKYLNSAYPANQDGLTDAQKAAKGDYETTKNNLISGSGGSVEGDEAATTTESEETSTDSKEKSADNEKKEASGDKYNYTYKNKADLDKSKLPSNGSSTKEVTDTELKMSETTDEDGNSSVNVSEGVEQQGKNSDTLLGNIGAALNAGLENAYILSYIFENFSYNTMVQDAVISNVKLNKNTVPAQITEAKGHLNNTTTLGKYLDQCTTLSNIVKNGKNNYLYGAEVEYILYGSTDPAKNVTYAKASIYGVRFIFNSIYAFTNSEIRNTTMSVGLAVQAATLGIVPYKVVQIVLQLALAAAESAVDLNMMNNGMKVAVVKTQDTWSLSISSAMKSASEVIATTAADAAGEVVNNLSNGLQSLVDAGADELTGAIEDAGNELQVATEKVITDFVDQAFSTVTKQIEEGLNSLQFVETANNMIENANTAKAKVQEQSDQMFTNVKNGLHKTLSDLCGGNEMLLSLLSDVENAANGLVDSVQQQVNSVISSVPEGKSITSYVTEKMTSIKQSMVTSATAYVSTLMEKVESVATDAVKNVKDKLNVCINEQGEEVRTKVMDTVNEYIGTHIDVGTDSVVGGGGSAKPSVASMIKFGYKDYMMLFTYLSICVNDDAVLLRTADMIQLNIQNAGEGASFKHNQAGSFKMANAFTYVNLTASAELDMFFLDLSIFQNILNDGEEMSEEETKGVSTITYNGILGY